MFQLSVCWICGTETWEGFDGLETHLCGQDRPKLPLCWAQLMSEDTRRQVWLGHLEGVLSPCASPCPLGISKHLQDLSPSAR